MGTENDSGKESKTLRVNKRSGILNKIKQWSKIGTAIATAIAAVLTPFLISLNAGGKADDAQKGATAGYKTLAPALEEVQKDLYAGMAALTSVAKGLASINEKREQDQKEYYALSERVTRCETYIEIMSRGRYKPSRDPVRERSRSIASVLSTEAAKVKARVPQLNAEVLSKKKARPIPKSLNQAQSYQQQRAVLRCPTKDPLCGVK